MKIGWMDLETYNEHPISNGAYKYAETAEVMLWAYAVDDEPPRCWDLTEGGSMPKDLSDLLWSDVPLVFHNGIGFDRVVLRAARNQTIKPSRIEDTMILAYQHSLPGSLDLLCDILKVPQDQAKLKIGKRLIHLFCKPQPKTSKVRRATRETHPTEWAQFMDYAMMDIVSMRGVYKRLPNWNRMPVEREYLLQDIRRNDRGVAVDMELVDAALVAIGREQKRLNARTQELTSNEVAAASQRDALLKHILASYGITLPDLQASTIERRLDDPDLPDALKELLRVRMDTCTTSTSKYKRYKSCTGSDGRLRGTIQFCGAQRTGRDAGRIVQPQNDPRPSLKHEEIEFGISALKADCADLVCDNVMELCASSVRGIKVAPPGKKLVVADLSNIEGRVLAWVAGEAWKIRAFEEFDREEGPDLYNLAYAKSFNINPKDVTKDQRQIGKVQELALGYEGGVGAFVTFAAAYKIDLNDLAAKADIPNYIRKLATEAWKWAEAQDRTLGLPEHQYIVCDSLKRMWREAHPETCDFWHDLRNAFVAAINVQNNAFDVGKVHVIRNRNWVRIMLPSGRSLCYPGAKLEGNGISYLGINQYTKKWQRIYTHGGKLTENIVQAIARDVFKWGELVAERAGYEVVMPIHDELVTEVPDTPKFSSEGLSACMINAPDWAEGLPLAAKGFETYRYRKD